MSAFAVVNPRSASGRTGHEWPSIERGLREIYPALSVGFTARRAEASNLVRRALSEGHTEIIAVGGDGTINEAVNGFFAADGAIAPDAVFAFVTSGTGGDFRKTFGIEAGPQAALAHLKIAKVRSVDIGRVSCLSTDGLPVTRYFINVASFGMSGVIVDRVNRARIAKWFGGSFAIAFHSAIGMLKYRDQMVRLRIDGEYDEIDSISTVAIANAQFFGGGMQIAPHAIPHDGEFDVVVIGGAPKLQAIRDLQLIYTGEHIKNPAVRVVRGRKVVAAPVAETHGQAVLIETDGENAGRLPATFDILPAALNLRC
ncbi:MAG TPA: YegS/Rv2252/BmrU family lipid kinase [Rhizomicrobium sp.]